MKWFTEHPSQSGETYLEHMRYALSASVKIYLYAIYLTSCSLAFIIHAVFPFVAVPKKLNLEQIGKRGFRFLKEGVQRDRQREDYQEER